MKAKNSTKSKTRLLISISIGSLIFGFLSFILSGFLLKSFSPNQFSNGFPIKLGQIKGIDIELHIGNIAVPNKMHPISKNPGSYSLDDRIKFWDAYIISAPVPKIVNTLNGQTIEIPWTLMPMSVCETVKQLDTTFSNELEVWLKLKTTESDWVYDRISHISPPEISDYRIITGITDIYSVNLFDFLNELGPNYKENLSRAISSAIKETVQSSTRIGIKKIAIPALAAAQYVREKDLILSYNSSFSSIFDGLTRITGSSPSQVIIVIWNSIQNTIEMESAFNGIRYAAFKYIPEYSKNLRTIVIGLIAFGIFFGAFLSYRIRTTINKKIKWTIILSILAILPLLFDYLYLNWIIGLLPLSTKPEIECSIIAFFSVIVGSILDNSGIKILNKVK